MPYMYCNYQGCNETVKLPAQYCAKHQPAKLPEALTVNVDANKVSKNMNTKKTTK